jgi:transposase
MIIHPGFVGIDISKNYLDVFDGAVGKHERFANSEADAILLALRFKASNSFVLFEATGRYDHLLRQFLETEGVTFSRVNPKRARDFARATGRIAKTDAIDANMLAAMAQTLKPPAHTPLCKKREVLCELHTRRDQLVAMRAQETNRLELLANSTIVTAINRHIKQLSDDIKSVDADIRDLIKADELLHKDETALISMPGFGPVTAHTLMAFLPELGACSPKAITAIAGLAPYNVDSGSFRGQRKISGGRRRVTRAMYMASLTAIRMNGIYQDFYKKLRAAGKPAKVALIAVARKLLLAANAIIRDKTCFKTAS